MRTMHCSAALTVVFSVMYSDMGKYFDFFSARKLENVSNLCNILAGYILVTSYTSSSWLSKKKVQLWSDVNLDLREKCEKIEYF